MGEFADSIEKIAEISYADLEGFPVSGVGDHAGNLFLGKVGGIEGMRAYLKPKYEKKLKAVKAQKVFE